jgi:hypothetical protein
MFLPTGALLFSVEDIYSAMEIKWAAAFNFQHEVVGAVFQSIAIPIVLVSLLFIHLFTPTVKDAQCIFRDIP